MPPHNLRQRKHEIGRRDARRQSSAQPAADNLRNQHSHRFAERRGDAFHAGDPPADNAQAIDHRRVTVDADHRIRIRDFIRAILLHAHDARQMLEVDLMADAAAWRHHAHASERAAGPAQESEAFRIALEFERHVARERIAAPRIIGDDRMIDDEIERDRGRDALRIAAGLAAASRIAARSPSEGMPAVSSIITRAGRNRISRGAPPSGHASSAAMSLSRSSPPPAAAADFQARF